MSDARAKAARSAAKDIRQGVTEQRPVSSKLKKKAKYKILVDLEFMQSRFNKKDYCIGKYVKLRYAEQAYQSALKVKYYTNVRMIEI